MGKTVRVHQTYMTSWSALGIAVICIMLVLATLWSEQPPAPKGENAPIEQFSAERAMKHVRAIAQLPHPSGSLENERVRTYLVEQMELLGLQPNVNMYPRAGQFNGISESFELHNIIGVHKGTKPGKALMLTAHYDSTPFGPGANDDAVGVAALLETARILQASPSMDRDIWFVLTDGEEKGLLGAEAFWLNNKVREQIGLVVNFEARGSRGPSIMFQTSRDNGNLISEFASFAVSPVSTSLLGDMYRTMPNETDLTVSLNAGIPGLNFGYIDGWDKYHSEQDTPDNVSMATFQHHGENALAAAKQFGSMDLEQLNGSDRVYFNWFTMLLHYPASWTIPMSILIGIGWLFCIAVFFKKRTITLKGMALSFLLTLGSIITSVVIGYLVFVGVMYIGSSVAGMPLEPASIPAQVNLAFVLIALLVHLVFTRLTRHRVNVLEMILTGMLFFFLLLIVVLGLIPGASYLFLFPLLIHCIVIGCTLHKRNPIIVLQRPWVSLVFALAPLTLTTSLFHVLYTGMPLQITVFTTVLCVLILTLLQPLMTSLTMVRRSRFAKIVDRK
ncbi:peptidase M28 [Paenibacillus sp. E194]|uniref:M28 family peptidase n=1 Tax=Paenibacillus sp. E194 TaxID=1458845 RepID=UPI0005E4EC35|nr:M28 family peptidase [Paenibacillus sp. E194]KJB88978.1 peptidase M28 [Paenibacillus sp. E194]